MKIQIKQIEELYHRYPHELKPQRVYVYFDAQKRVLGAEYDSVIGSGVPFAVWHGHIKRWTIPCLRQEVALALLQEIEPICERIVAGYENHWNGSNHVARYSDDAKAAIEEVSSLIESRSWDKHEQLVVWEACDWYAPIGSAEIQARTLGINALTTDAELDAIEAREIGVSWDEAVDVIEGLRRHLEWLRTETRDATEESREIESAS